MFRNAAHGVDPAMLEWSGNALAALRKIKSENKVSMKTPILDATLELAEAGAAFIREALTDIAEAGRVTGPITLATATAAPASPSEEAQDTDAVVVTASTLGEAPARGKQ